MDLVLYVKRNNRDFYYPYSSVATIVYFNLGFLDPYL